MRVGGASLLLPILLTTSWGCAQGPPPCTQSAERLWFVDADGDGYGDPDRYIITCEVFEGFVQNAGDCDDGDEGIFPFSVELCDGIDNDCDRQIDEGWFFSFWYPDEDGDGFGSSRERVLSCRPVDGHVEVLGDCDDTDRRVHPDADETCDGRDEDCDGRIDDADDDLAPGEGDWWFLDLDGDGFAGEEAQILSCLIPIGGALVATDCDDTDPLVSPVAVEVCDGIDNDCDQLTDDSDPGVDPLGQRTWFLDADRDGLGDPDQSLTTCTEPWYWVLNAADCDDQDADVGAIGEMRWREDRDGDGVGGGLPSGIQCTQPGEGWVPMSLGLDCDDLDPLRSPSFLEGCDGLDNDCDGLVDDEDPSLAAELAGVFFVDGDGDGFGAAPWVACALPGGAVELAGDCDDDDSFAFPGATELCNGIDDDCDGLIDDADPDRNPYHGQTVYRDRDGDGFGDPFTAERMCAAPEGWVALGGDCDDSNGLLGIPTLWWPDRDGDRYGSGELVGPTCVPPTEAFVLFGEEDCDDEEAGVHPALYEVCEDGIDQDCDGLDARCPLASCAEILEAGLSTGDGVYLIEPDEHGPVEVWCDMLTDGGGWTLVSSSDWPVDDAVQDYSTNLSNLAPESPMDGVWGGLREVLPSRSDLRFACHDLPEDEVYEVDLIFYDVHWYREITSGDEASVCFNQDNGAGYDSPPERLNVLTGSIREEGNNWNDQGYLEGEDLCDAPDDFTVDFDDRGMDGNQSDGTDWGEDDGLKKCGRTNRGSSWFIFVR